MSKTKPIAGELWLEHSHNWHIFITQVGSFVSGSTQSNGWVWWENLDMQTKGNSSVEWFVSNCKRISRNER